MRRLRSAARRVFRESAERKEIELWLTLKFTRVKVSLDVTVVKEHFTW